MTEHDPIHPMEPVVDEEGARHRVIEIRTGDPAFSGYAWTWRFTEGVCRIVCVDDAAFAREMRRLKPIQSIGYLVREVTEALEHD